MGIIIDRLKNLSIEPKNVSITLDQDPFKQMTDVAVKKTGGFLGIAMLVISWLSIFFIVTDKTRQFNITKAQALVVTSTIVFTLAIFLIYLDILTSLKHFVWFGIIMLISNILVIRRVSN